MKRSSISLANFLSHALAGALRLWPDRRGAVAAFVAVGIVPTVGFVGLATDAARGYMVKTKLHQALDAAGLAGGRAILEPDRDADIIQFFNANFPDGYLGATVNGPNIDADETEGLLTLMASADIPTSFMQVLGFNDISVSARTVVHRAVRGMELALIMDNTGSMRGGGKMDAMKSAAHDLIDILYGYEETVNDFWVSLVPYAATVNVGANRTAWLEAYDAETISRPPGKRQRITRPMTLSASTTCPSRRCNPISAHSRTSTRATGSR